MKTQAHTIYKLKDGTIVPSVTTITGLFAKPQLVSWANRLGLKRIDVTKYVDDKAEIGSLAHELVLNYFKQEETDLSDYSPKVVEQAQNSFKSFQKFIEGKDIKVKGVEMQMVSEEYKYGGTCDLFAEVDGVLTLIDWKTGSGIFKTMGFQLSAYANLIKENFGVLPKTMMIVRIPRSDDEEFEVKSFDFEKNWEIFKRLLEIYYLLRR